MIIASYLHFLVIKYYGDLMISMATDYTYEFNWLMVNDTSIMDIPKGANRNNKK